MLCKIIVFLILFIQSFIFSSDIDSDARVYFDDSIHYVGSSVNILKGSFSFFAKDLEVKAAEPLCLTRCYGTNRVIEYDGGWIFFPHLEMRISMKNPMHYTRIFAKEPSGVTVPYEYAGMKKENMYWFCSDCSDGAVGDRNTSGGSISGRSNVNNNKILIDIIKEKREGKKKRVKIVNKAIVYAADGTQRIYEALKIQKDISECDSFTFYLFKEILPNGNHVLYKYNETKRISKITTTNPSETKIYASMSFDYSGQRKEKCHDFTVTTSNNKEGKYLFWRPDEKYIHDYFYLNKISGDGVLPQSYDYDEGFEKKKNHSSYDMSRGPYLNKIDMPNDSYFFVKYFWPKNNEFPNHDYSHEDYYIKRASSTKCNKVQYITEPVGPNGENVDTYAFRYHLGKAFRGGYDKDGVTEVRDRYGNQILFSYSMFLRLKDITRTSPTPYGNKEYFKDTFIWGGGGKESQIKIKKTEDLETGECRAKLYEYDYKGNVIKETFYGNLTGEGHSKIDIKDDKIISNGVENYRVEYEYSKDGFNLPTSKYEENGQEIRYTYKPGTDLLLEKKVLLKGSVVSATVYEYNNDNILIRQIEGYCRWMSCPSTADSSGSYYSKITKIKPKATNPAINLPEEIEELYYDTSKGCEVFLKRTIFHYSDKAEVVQEDIYDANNEFRYSIFRQYNDFGKVIEESDPIGQVNYYDYDINGNLTYEKKAGSTISYYYIYDKANRLVEKQEHLPSGEVRLESYTYNEYGKKLSETNFQGLVVLYSYDSRGNLIKKVEKDIPTSFDKLEDIVTLYKHDAFGREVYRKEPNGDETKTKYNSYDKPILIIHPDGAEERFTYSSSGELICSIDQEGNETIIRRDALGRVEVKEVFSPSGEALSGEFLNYQERYLEARILAFGNATYYRYDGIGKPVLEELRTPDDSHYKRFFYDALGRLHKVKNGADCPSFSKLKETFPHCSKDGKRNAHREGSWYYEITERDLLSNVIEERVEDLDGIVFRKIQHEYDGSGNKIKEIKYDNNQPNATLFFYDCFNRLVKEIAPDGNEKTCEFNDFYKNHHGQYVSQIISTDSLGTQSIETLTIDGKTASIRKIDKDGILLSLQESYYDIVRNLSRNISYNIFHGKTVNSSEVRWDYGPLNRLVTLVEGHGSSNQKTFSYTYTPRGFLFQTVKPDGVVIENKYDGLGNLISLISSDGSCSYSYKYNAEKQVIRSVDENSKTETLRGIDGHGNILLELLANGLFLQKSYDDISRPVEIILPDLTSIKKEYIGLNLKKVTRLHNWKDELYSQEYTSYDLSGNLLSTNMIGNLGNATYKIGENCRLSEVDTPYFTNKVLDYDKCGRVTKALWNSTDTRDYYYDGLGQVSEEKGFFNITYECDSQLNRLKKQDEEYEVNDINQLTSTSSSKYTYDPNGNLTSKVTGDEEIRYSYDALDRLIAIEFPYESKVKYTYDSFHRRMSKENYKWVCCRWEKVDSTRYLYDDQNEIASYDLSDNCMELRVLGVQEKAEIGSAVAIEIDGEAYAPIHDLFGNVTSLVSLETKEVVEEYNFSVFGEEESSQKELINPWRFCSKRKEAEINLINFGRRFYDPELGRWISPDPKGFTDSYNLYAYVFNDPFQFFDLYGMHVGDDLRDRGVDFSAGAAYMFDNNNLAIENLYTSGKLHPDCRNWQDPKNEPPPNIDYTKGIIFFVNGINTTDEEAASHANYISQFSKDTPVHAINNPTHGICSDISETLYAKFGVATAPLIATLTGWMRSLESQDGDILHIAHSQGVLITKMALLMAPQNWRDRINVVTIAGASMISEDLCKSAVNYVSNKDIVPFFAPERWNPGNHDNIHVLDSAEKGFAWDHSFQSETYSNPIKDQIRDYENRVRR